jgi:RNA polymerase sigma-70 factor (ECF subfamily)
MASGLNYTRKGFRDFTGKAGLVLEKPESFAGQSTLRTYVTGIMKYKIIDALRASKRERQFETQEDQSEDDVIDALFKADGHTQEMPRRWGDPDATLEQKLYRAFGRASAWT